MSIGDLSGIPKSKSNVYAGLSGLPSCTRTEDLKFYIIMEINVSLNKIHLKVIKHLTRTCMYTGSCPVKPYSKPLQGEVFIIVVHNLR